MHRYQIIFEHDADYVVLESLQSGGWVEHTRWMVPGSQIADEREGA